MISALLKITDIMDISLQVFLVPYITTLNIFETVIRLLCFSEPKKLYFIKMFAWYENVRMLLWKSFHQQELSDID